jgi:hypothetical protein
LGDTMSRMVSPQNQADIQATSSSVAWLFLLTIEAKDKPPLYLVNNNEVFVSNGIEYQPFPFALNLPSDTGERLPRIQIVISNISNEIIEAIRAEITPPVLTIEMVSSAYPDIVEKRLDFLTLRGVSYDASTITGELEVINVMSTAFPAESYSPVHYPGLFR